MTNVQDSQTPVNQHKMVKKFENSSTMTINEKSTAAKFVP
jgi:hypothetical protein